MKDDNGNVGLTLDKSKRQNTQYQYSYVPLEIVEKNIDEFIIPELQPACKSLWERNIFTFMCSNRNDNGSAYILLEPLSEVNAEIFKALSFEKPKNYIYDENRKANCICIPDVTNMSKTQIADAFMDLTKLFIMQDVSQGFYHDKEEYLIMCGCYKEIENPNYTEPMPIPTKIVNQTPEGVKAFLKQIDEWENKARAPKTIKVFDPEMQTKPLIDYVIANGDLDKFDAIEDKVFIDKYYLRKHINYVNRKSNIKTK